MKRELATQHEPESQNQQESVQEEWQNGIYPKSAQDCIRRANGVVTAPEACN